MRIATGWVVVLLLGATWIGCSGKTSDTACPRCNDAGSGEGGEVDAACPDCREDAGAIDSGADGFAPQPLPPLCSDPALAGFHVTPNGSASGDGTLARPWDLATALTESSLSAGAKIWIHGGTYRGTFDSTLSGTAAAPIVVRQCRGERAIVDGNMTIEGSNTWFWGFEVTNTSHATNDLQNVDAHSPGVRFINMISHDATGDGFGIWAESPNAEAYGNIIYNNGIRGTTCIDPADFRTCSHGHGIYSQNQTGTKRLADNILFDQFGYNIHVYGSDAAFLDHFTIDGNVSFNAGRAGGSGDDILIGGGAAVHDLAVTNNMTFSPNGTTASIGYNFGPANESATVTGNTFVGLVYVDWWNAIAFSHNALIDGNSLLTLQLMSAQSSSGYTWDGNAYTWTGVSAPFAINRAGTTTGYDFSGWKAATGRDASSTFSSAAVSGNQVFLRPNAYESGRANIVIYNWDDIATISVDASSVLNDGDHYELHNTQDYFGAPVLSGTYSGAPLAVPMIATEPPAPVEGWDGVIPPVTGPTFGVFVLTRTGP